MKPQRTKTTQAAAVTIAQLLVGLLAGWIIAQNVDWIVRIHPLLPYALGYFIIGTWAIGWATIPVLTVATVLAILKIPRLSRSAYFQVMLSEKKSPLKLLWQSMLFWIIAGIVTALLMSPTTRQFLNTTASGTISFIGGFLLLAPYLLGIVAFSYLWKEAIFELTNDGTKLGFFILWIFLLVIGAGSFGLVTNDFLGPVAAANVVIWMFILAMVVIFQVGASWQQRWFAWKNRRPLAARLIVTAILTPYAIWWLDQFLRRYGYQLKSYLLFALLGTIFAMAMVVILHNTQEQNE